MAPLGSKRRRQDAQATATSETRGEGSGESDGVALDFFSELDALLAGVEDGATPGLLDSPLPRDMQRPVRRKSATLKPILPGPSSVSTPVVRTKPKSSTQRQKEELQFLRARVSELQAELDRIKERQLAQVDADKASLDALELGGGFDMDSTNLWRSIAVSQREERSKAEKENAKLVASVQAQIKLARSLEKLLSKPQVWDQLQEDHWQKSEQITKTDSEWFHDLVQSIDSRHPLLDSVLNSNGLHYKSPEVDDIKLKYATDDGIMIENKMIKVLPFDFDICHRVLWRALRQGKINVYSFPLSIVAESDDVVLTKMMIHRSPIIDRPVTVYQAFKRYVGNNEISVISEIAGMTTEMAGPAPAVQVIGQAWVRITPSALPDGTFGTKLQVYTTSILNLLEPTSSSRDQTEGHYEIGILSQLIMSAMREKKQLTRQLVENLLLDATLCNM